jgi:hypothetical protein
MLLPLKEKLPDSSIYSSYFIDSFTVRSFTKAYDSTVSLTH